MPGIEDISGNIMARRFKTMARHIAKLIPPDEAGFTRAGGEAKCPYCGLTLYHHPEVSGGDFVIACNGRQYKL